MEPRVGKIVLNGAPSQYDRRLPALAPGYAPVDGRTFTDLLNFPVEYGALINFYNLSDAADGDWVGFFLSDPTMMLAQLDRMDPAEIDREFTRLYERTRAAYVYQRKFDLFCQLFTFIQALARQVNDTLLALDPAPEQGVARLLWLELTNAIKISLGPQLRQLKAYAEGAALPRGLHQEIPLDWSGFLPIWGLRDDCPDDSIYRGFSRIEKINHALPHLAPIFAAFRESFVDFQTFARANFEASLEESDHKPQIGLYIAFARLFAMAQATINTISSRYVHFYYNDILRESPAGAIPDRVYLTFTLADDEAVTSTTVPAGTGFPAGQDAEGRDILYACEKSLPVGAAALDLVHTLRVVRGPLLAGQPNTTVVTERILSSDILLADAIKNSIPWPTFGAAEPDASAVAVTMPATMGFALSSPYLLLSGGERDIGVVVGYSETFRQVRLDPLLDEIAAVVGFSPDEILKMVLDGAFTVLASTEAGWLPVAYKAELPDPTSASFVLRIKLPETAPPIAAYDPAAAEGGAAPAEEGPVEVNPAPQLPTLKFELRQQAVTLYPPTGEAGATTDVYPLSLLDGMTVETLKLTVDVAGLSDVELQSTIGDLDASAPFPVFGAPPVVGSYLEVGKEELFVKRVEALSLAIDWFDLPVNDTGFKGYYRDYKIGLDGRPEPDLFDNTKFRGSVSVTNPGSWTITQDGEDLNLFRTKPGCDGTEPAVPLCPSTTFDFPSQVIGPHVPPAYYAPSDGALRLTLTAPRYAFGDDLYAQNVLNSVIADLPDGTTYQEIYEGEYAVLMDSAQAIGVCIDECGLQPDDKLRDCISTCLTLCVGRLLLNAVQCLGDCATRSQVKLDAATFTEMQSSFEAARNAPQDVRAGLLEQWIEVWRGKGRLDVACLNKCLRILEAVAFIGICQHTCATKADEDYRACILPRLKSCQTQLEDAYTQFGDAYIAACSKPKEPLAYPNAPWLPSAQRVTIAYSAEGSLLGGEWTDGVFFHLLPFGGYERASTPCTLLPMMADEGSLYLGFSGLAPPQTLTLLFQMASSAASASGGDPASVTYEYLARAGWKRLWPAEVTADGTNGLENSGILALNLPAYDPVGTTMLPGDQQWLRLSVAVGAALFADTIGIYPNATSARWQDLPDTGNTLGQPLPAHTITSSVQPLSYIDTIDQPMKSFGGRPPESRDEFETRLGERLRHKDRAIAAWDYERLVLARFPTVWKVQALPARNPWHGNAPGDVLVVVVAGPDTLDVVDPTVPSASGALLGAIHEYLEGLTSPFVSLHVVNPVYVRITVSVTVQFTGDEDTGAAITRLNDELVRYLSPWFYNAARAATHGHYVSEDEIEAFIETQAGVEGIWNFSVDYDRPTGELEWYFLTSVQEHDIVAADIATVALRGLSANHA